MDLSRATSQLLSNQQFVQDLPEGVLEILQTGINAQYLDTLARLALSPAHAPLIFSTQHQLSVEICSRWLCASMPGPQLVAAFATLARVLPIVPYLLPFLWKICELQNEGPLSLLLSRNTVDILELPEDSLHAILLALCRLLRFDSETLVFLVSPAQLQLLLGHGSRSIRYLAIRVLCLYLHASEVAVEEMIQKYLGRGTIDGKWEDKVIDYTFFGLWEVKRLRNLHEASEHGRLEHEPGSPLERVQRVFDGNDFSATTVCLSGVLLPCFKPGKGVSSSWKMTPIVNKNMQALATAIRGDRPVLVTGSLGAGKTSLVREAARRLGCDEDMLVLHLNDQVDAKLLIGMYTSAGESGSFTWQPGVLTKAVTEGRWVMIEDFDRAPAEVVSTLLPLLERRELFVPHWGESVPAAPGFKIITTVRSFNSTDRKHVLVRKTAIGARHWEEVHIASPSVEELGEIVIQRHPRLHAYLPRLLSLYTRLEGTEVTASLGKQLSRGYGPHELFRWCSRVDDILIKAGVKTGFEPISDVSTDGIFLEAVDCFAGSLPVGREKSHVIDTIAQELHTSRERVSYCLSVRKPDFVVTADTLRAGRTILPRKKLRDAARLRRTSQSAPFATTDHVLRQLESIATTINMAEPCLLVGETGTGKTTIAQRLADALNRKLIVVNLSQQSEAGDLLGGFKPVNMRALALPMMEEFTDLFESTFSAKKNQRYVEHVAKAISKNRWSRALTLWKEAHKMVQSTFRSQQSGSFVATDEPFAKKRKVDSPRLLALSSRWDEFAGRLVILQKHLESGSKGFAFSFVEGNIVKAARNGDWVLLDEINLAAPDTLESLADLFAPRRDESSSLLLTETGNTERITVHKDFRVFGAMNPATDIGKRDLPPSLRSRFTELFIDPPDRRLDDLISLAQVYLGKSSAEAVRLASDVAHLYLGIQQLASDNQLVDGAEQKPHFSLRTLTRTLVFAIDIAPFYGLRRALFEGFSMSFLTPLNRASISHITPLMDKHLLGNSKNKRALLLQPPKLPADAGGYVKFKQYLMTKGPFPIIKQDHYIITPFIENNLLNLVRATSTRRFPVLLQGPTSSGKTSMVEYLANISGHKFVRINNHEHTDLQEYLGTYLPGPGGQLEYQEGVLVQALREGFWVVLDELNLAPTDVLEALNRLLDDNRELLIPETQQIVRPHENFMLFATQNPPGVYGGRKVLSRAFRNRFLELHFDDIPEDELEIILRERSQIAPSFCAKIVAVYKKLSLHRQQSRLFEQKGSFATLRDLFRWALRDADDKEQLAINGYYLLAERVRNNEERQVVKRTIQEVMRVTIDVDVIYGGHKIPLPGDFQPSASGIVWTKSMRRLYVLVTEAIKAREPVLLVGDTGSGKTTICQVIAAVMKTRLHIVNAHQNMETGDLIGSQRPNRSRASIEARLHKQLSSIFSHQLSDEERDICSLEKLVQRYKTLPMSDVEKLSSTIKQTIEDCLAQHDALFEWVDGGLVHAMKNGHHFLLDEISLADDSVLERLNSVLEPGRKLFLAEKGVNDALVVAADGFQFLATMNPGGEYGKKELSLALRNRFTEIWVPHASDQSELEEIIQEKLSEPLTRFAAPMVDFALWYGTRFGNSAMPVSIRDLLSWAAFLETRCLLDEYSSILHGAALVYIDALGANPAAMLQSTNLAVGEQRQTCLDKLTELFHHDMAGAYWASPHIDFLKDHIRIGPFSMKKRVNNEAISHYSSRAPTTMRNAMKIARALQLPRPILLEGNPGVGKTSLVVALAQACGACLTRINLSDQTDLMDLFGSDVPVEGGDAGHFAWRDAPFLKAMQNGEWVLLDEMNLASQSVLEGLNACFDHRGQVYIPELDRVFTRHPDFVAFAAQNPHHQGSGRKGLPTSFVNRFSVVYADMFSAEDLLTICSDAFPSLPSNELQRLTECTAELEKAVQRHQLGTQGGPWEINLRDTIRWLDLLSSTQGLLSAGKAADYVSMLFQQRFRTAEDTALVHALLNDHFPQLEEARCRAVGVNANYVQLGLAMFPRCSGVSTFRSQRHNVPFSHLRFVESVMLCVAQNWPCLLVGPSGSGKTNILSNVASCVGAELVEFAMSADMDTMDLVGGYEQLDSQRETAHFVRRLKGFVEETRLQRLLSLQGQPDTLAILDELLQASPAKIGDIVHCIEQLQSEDSGFSLQPLMAEGVRISERSLADNRARFQWVDGLLVRAVVEGKWLVLDNANLCSSSVLDRLNSLLEPNGVLIITEQRSADGSARIVKPHPNFRLFLTADPRHGELSRAMRNRCIELFIALPEEAQLPGTVNLTSEPAMARFEQLQKISLPSIEGLAFEEQLWIFLVHLAFSDHSLLKRFSLQISAGLLEPSLESRPVMSIIQIFLKMLNGDGGVLRSIKDVYYSIAQQFSLPQGFAETQSLQPFQNPVLSALALKTKPSHDFIRLSLTMDMLIDLLKFEGQFMSTVESSSSLPTSQLSRLQRSMASRRNRQLSDASMQGLAEFLSESAETLGSALGEVALTTQWTVMDETTVFDTYADIYALKDFFFYLLDLFDLTNSAAFDEAVFQVYLDLGKGMIASFYSHIPLRDMANTLNTGIDRFSSSSKLSAGQSMERIWTCCRPPTPASLPHLQKIMQVERLAERLDNLLWMSDASLRGMNQLQKSIQSLVSITASAPSDDGDLHAISDAVDELEISRGSHETQRKPYFQQDFEALRQYSTGDIVANCTKKHELLSLLAGAPTRDLEVREQSEEGWGPFLAISHSTGAHRKDTALAGVRNIFPISAMSKLEILSEVPLVSLGLLQEEIKHMATVTAEMTASIMMDPHKKLSSVLRALHRQIAIAHGDLLQHDQFSLDSDVFPNARVWLPKDALSDSHYFRDITRSYLNPSYSHVATNEPHQSPWVSLASAWILFFTGCLKLYVPDRAFDPALKPLVVRDRHRKRRSALESKLSALRLYERLTTGQTTNPRCHFLEMELQALGDDPAVHAVLRPEVSELAQLQGDFDNILHSICSRLPDDKVLSQMFSKSTLAGSEMGLLRSNITQAIARLQQSFRTYDDMTKPLIATLQGLDAGLSMAQIAMAPVNSQMATMEYICRHTPFFGMRPASLNQDISVGHCQDQSDSSYTRLKRLECLSLLKNTAKDTNAFVPTVMVQDIHCVFKEWKQQLGEDQGKTLAKSSMYRYRGGEADEEMAGEEDFDELFPNSEVDVSEQEAQKGTNQTPQQLSLRMAGLVRDLFSSRLSPADKLLGLINRSSADLARLWQPSSPTATSPLAAIDLLSGLVLQLDDKRAEVGQGLQKASLYNWYTHANISEAQKLIGLVRRLQSRFQELKQAWPEHATLDDVLRVSSDLLDLKHTEPLARLITKVEQLHGYVHEWQLVASREFSASMLYDQLTAMIVSWRRLELTTWSRLFDMEDRKCETEVDSWWFIAYEAIVAAPLSIVEAGDDLKKHAENLFKTLEDFVSNSSIGHFQLRIQMLHNFRQYLEMVEKGYPDFRTMEHTLSNFLHFYNRYEGPVQETLKSGRMKLEKEMKDVLLLASWKDTNINALRDSAKRSHHKLFKLVRKYRALLAQPVQQIIEQGLPEQVLTPSDYSTTVTLAHDPDASAIETCQSLSFWSARPARFQNVSSTASAMAMRAHMPSLTQDMAQALDQFTDGLVEDIKSLRKATPAEATDDNTDFLKHLTSQKRKLLSDTLKSLRHMGFRANMSTDVLTSQLSRAAILTQFSPINSDRSSNDIEASESYLHQFLHSMPAVREASRAHSDDLTTSEVSRSVGFLESMLSRVIQHRVTIGELGIALESLGQSLGKMQHLWKPGSYEVSNIPDVAPGDLRATIARIPHIVEVGCIIIEKHGSMGELDHSIVLTDLRARNIKIQNMATSFAEEFSLPDKITSSKIQSNSREARLLLNDLGKHLDELTARSPGLGFVFHQIKLWTEVVSETSNGHHFAPKASSSLREYDQQLTKLCDSVLVTIQESEKSLSQFHPTEDNGWLVNSEHALAAGTQALHVKKITSMLTDTMDKLATLSTDDLPKAAALTATVLPILNQYHNICQSVFDYSIIKSRAMNKLAATLAKSFSQIASQGFCNPSKAGAADSGKNEKLEEGTGLGEGEGAEDISKDIQDDEDLSELAQQGQKSKEGEEIEDQEDAVNMDQDELEGEMGDAPDKEGEDEEASGAESGEDEIDEETGDVDDLGPNAVDEKFWDDDAKGNEKEKEGSKKDKGGKKDEEMKAEDQMKDVDGDDVEEEEMSEDGADEGVERAQQEAEKMDPYAQQEENLDLPDQMDLDGPERSSVGSDLDDDDMENLSDVETGADEKRDEADSDEEQDDIANPMEDGAKRDDLSAAGSEDVPDDKGDEAASPVDTEPEEDSEDDQGLLRNQTQDTNVDENNVAPSDVQGLDGQDADQQTETHDQENTASGSTGAPNEQSSADQQQAASKEGQLGAVQDVSQDAADPQDPGQEDYTSQAFKKLGDALEKWHRQQRKIRDAQSSPAPEQQAADTDMTDAELQHLENEDQAADTQALGGATEDQAHALDQRALDSEMQDQPQDFFPDQPEDLEDENTTMQDQD
ncbi:MAG: hypothetical protein Q9174_001492, partial [Haloplaca sp. 1 TL-2023]